MTDTIADMLTRVRNALVAKHETVDVPASTTKVAASSIAWATACAMACCPARGCSACGPWASTPVGAKAAATVWASKVGGSMADISKQGTKKHNKNTRDTQGQGG